MCWDTGAEEAQCREQMTAGEGKAVEEQSGGRAHRRCKIRLVMGVMDFSEHQRLFE